MLNKKRFTLSWEIPITSAKRQQLADFGSLIKNPMYIAKAQRPVSGRMVCLNIGVMAVVQIRVTSALLLFQSGQLSRGAACEFADVDIYTFMAACKKYGISIINANSEDIEADVLRFEQRHSI